MSFANSSISDIVATTIESRSGQLADNVTKNNALLAQLKRKGRVRPFSGGRTIYEELVFAENANVGSYSGYDTLPVAAQDVISAAEFAIKQYACPVTISGLEELQNAGKEGLIDLLEGRISAAEASLMNRICDDLYGDGTGNGGKDLVGLDAAVPQAPTSGTYGGIDRATWTFWQSQLQDETTTSSSIQAAMNSLWAKCVRGSDRPDLILAGSTQWQQYMASLQTLQRFTDTNTGNLGFPSIKFMDADVVLDGGIGGFATTTDMYFLNTKYIHFRPHSKRNFVSLKDKQAVNQDATVSTLVWAGALTMSGSKFQGRGKFD
jgi:hypothetical protein